MIAIRNIYYMLSYAFRVLREQGYQEMETEEFENGQELCAAILIRGISMQIRRGLGRDYLPVTETRSTLRGKIMLSESVRSGAIFRRQLVCMDDEFSLDTPMNRILKSVMELLLHSGISQKRKKALRKLLVYFRDVSLVDLHRVNWNLQYHRNNQTYRMLMFLCRLVTEGLLQSPQNGARRMAHFLDDQQMYQLYERFIREYYRQEFPQITVSAPQILWQLDDPCRDFLPAMQADVMLQYEKKILIIDAKYYKRILREHYGKQTLYSSNLYQIFTYVKNKEAQLAGQGYQVSGLLLYAGTEEEEKPQADYHMSGNRIGVRTLDLGGDFEDIRNALDGIAEEYLGV